MSGSVGIVAFALVLIVSVLIHEAAHMVVAKAFGFKVEEYFVGFGPKLWSTKRGETEYGIKAILAGGYVKIAGMDPYKDPDPEDLPRSYGAKPRWQRALVIVAGPVTHFVLAAVLFALWLGLVGNPTFAARIEKLVPTLNHGIPSPAAVAGIRRGDVVTAVGDLRHPTYQEFQDAIAGNVGHPIRITVERDGVSETVTATPVESTAGGRQIARIGVVLGVGPQLSAGRRDPPRALAEGVGLVGVTVKNIFANIGRIFGPEGFGRIGSLIFGSAHRSVNDVTSVVGAARAAGDLASSGRFGDVLFLFAALNVFIGLLNLVPLPPFDGGHLAVLAIEKIRGRRVDLRKLVPVSVVVLTFFILFSLSLIYLDIVKPIPLSP